MTQKSPPFGGLINDGGSDGKQHLPEGGTTAKRQYKSTINAWWGPQSPVPSTRARAHVKNRCLDPVLRTE